MMEFCYLICKNYEAIVIKKCFVISIKISECDDWEITMTINNDQQDVSNGKPLVHFLNNVHENIAR